MDSKTLAQQIKRAREYAGLTQDELSDKAGLAYSTLAKIEQGAIRNPSVFTVVALAQSLETTVEALVKGAPPVTSIRQNSQTPVRFVFCDMNGVMVRFYHHAFVSLAEESGAPFEKIETTFWHYNDAANRGEMSLADFNRAMADHLLVDKVDWQKHYMGSIQPIKEMWQLLKYLRRSYKIGLLTNTMPGFIEVMRQRGLLPDFKFDAVIDSSEAGAVKPEEKIYQIAETTIGCKGPEIFLIDDSRTNLTAAEKRGWRVFWFDDYDPDESIRRIEQSLPLR